MALTRALLGARGPLVVTTNHRSGAATYGGRNIAHRFLLAMLFVICGALPAQAQSYTPTVIAKPKVSLIDDNYVSMISGKDHFTIPALKLGDVSYTPYSFNGEHFQQGGLIDENYGYIVMCSANFGTNYAGTPECAVHDGTAMQVVYGQERETFHLVNGQYSPDSGDGSAFVDNGSTCTWIKSDGTRIVYVAYHTQGNPLCLSNNIASITYLDGRIATYYYYGAFSTQTEAWSPILSITTNTGYMLKYNYPGTPAFGSQTSVVAFNRAFEACDPAAVSCTLTGSWPTATLSWQNKTVSPCDNFPSLGTGYNSCNHYIFTIQSATHEDYVFELDSYFRVISYQPPGATSPVYNYTLCSNHVGGAMTNCFGDTYWPGNPNEFDPGPLLWDLVSSVTRNGQVWTYGAFFTPGGNPPQGYSMWQHTVTSPLGTQMAATGNATPGTEFEWGPIESVSQYDGTSDHYYRSVQNQLAYVQMPSGLTKSYSYYGPAVSQITQTPIAGSGLSSIVESASYLTTCINLVACFKPIAVTDANGNETDYTYDPTHGGVLTETDPAVNGVRPQIRRTDVQRNAGYLNASGVMTRDPNPVWLLATQSYCRTGAASGAGCAIANDEVVTTYDYGPDSGPNNLLLRGETVTGDGQSLRTCYGHDHQGNKIWETSPNANPASCPAY
jgi:YD repeat-containing protein